MLQGSQMSLIRNLMSGDLPGCLQRIKTSHLNLWLVGAATGLLASCVRRESFRDLVCRIQFSSLVGCVRHLLIFSAIICFSLPLLFNPFLQPL